MRRYSYAKRRSEIAGILWGMTGVVSLISLWSFHPTDPSLNNVTTGQPPLNWTGYFGSYLSDIFYQTFGMSTWIIIAALFIKSYRSFQDHTVWPSKVSFLFLWISLITSSGLLGLHFSKQVLFNGTIKPGGLVGFAMTEALIPIFHFAGLAILLWSVTLVFIVFYSGRSITELTAMPLPFLRRTLPLLYQWCLSKITEIKRQKTLRALNHTVVLPTEKKQFPSSSEEKLSIRFPLTENRKRHMENTKTNQVRKGKAKSRIENWTLPSLSHFKNHVHHKIKWDDKTLYKNTDVLQNKLAQFNVHGKVVAVKPGPAVTLYEFKPNADVKISKITELADDLSLALKSESVRIIAPLPGRDVVGIETANPKRETVYLRDILDSSPFWEEKIRLPLAIGKKVNGQPHVVDLRSIPHLLVAGTTGSGKSVFVISLLAGLVFRHSPKTLRLILIDPKQVDLTAFHNVPHLLMPPIREIKKAVVGLKWAISEMEKRYRSMSKFGCRNVDEFNLRVSQLTKNEKADCERFNEELGGGTSAPSSYYFEELPYIVIVVEEFGDLMAVDKLNVEQTVVRLAQMARACGIHLILAMQSPRRNVVTGLIKTNIPGRISFKVASKTDSRIILDESGAERLLARGDMLFLAPGVSKPIRHHGAWMPENELHQLTTFWSEQAAPEYDRLAEQMLLRSGENMDSFMGATLGTSDVLDKRYDEIFQFVASQKEVSASMLQRRFRLGYPRAARMIEIFEDKGVVGPAKGSKPRQVLVNGSP